MEILNFINNIDLNTIPQLLFCLFGIIKVSHFKIRDLSIKSFIYTFLTMMSIVLIRHRLNNFTMISLGLFTFLFSIGFIHNNFFKSLNLTVILILFVIIIDNIYSVTTILIGFPNYLHNITSIIIYLLVGFLLIKLLKKLSIPYDSKILTVFLLIIVAIYYFYIYLNFQKSIENLNNIASEKLTDNINTSNDIEIGEIKFFTGTEPDPTFVDKLSSIKFELSQIGIMIGILTISFLFIHLILKSEKEKNLDEYYRSLELNYNEIRKFRHDYKNILTTLDALIYQEDIEGLKKFHESIIEEEKDKIYNKSFNLERLSKINIKYLKGFLFRKIMEAEEKNIDVFLDIGDSIDEINIKDLDLVRVLGIILDNAVEELEHLKTGLLSIVFIVTDNSKIIIVENTCREDILKLHELKREGFSTKGEKRGLGLSNLEEILSKYRNITHEIQVDNGKFLQKIEIRNN